MIRGGMINNLKCVLILKVRTILRKEAKEQNWNLLCMSSLLNILKLGPISVSYAGDLDKWRQGRKEGRADRESAA